MQCMTIVLVGFFSAALLLQGATNYKVVGRYPIPGVGGFDYVTLDNSARRLYVSHGTQVDVLDADNGKVLGTISDTPGVHGVAIVSDFKRGFTSNARDAAAHQEDRCRQGARRHLLRSGIEASVHQ